MANKQQEEGALYTEDEVDEEVVVKAQRLVASGYDNNTFEM